MLKPEYYLEEGSWAGGGNELARCEEHYRCSKWQGFDVDAEARGRYVMGSEREKTVTVSKCAVHTSSKMSKVGRE